MWDLNPNEIKTGAFLLVNISSYEYFSWQIKGDNNLDHVCIISVKCPKTIWDRG
jgi:hypothetical protein